MNVLHGLGLFFVALGIAKGIYAIYHCWKDKED